MSQKNKGEGRKERMKDKDNNVRIETLEPSIETTRYFCLLGVHESAKKKNWISVNNNKKRN